MPKQSAPLNLSGRIDALFGEEDQKEVYRDRAIGQT
jgi:hypothetical protein